MNKKKDAQKNIKKKIYHFFFLQNMPPGLPRTSKGDVRYSTVQNIGTFPEYVESRPFSSSEDERVEVAT